LSHFIDKLCNSANKIPHGSLGRHEKKIIKVLEGFENITSLEKFSFKSQKQDRN